MPLGFPSVGTFTKVGRDLYMQVFVLFTNCFYICISWPIWLTLCWLKSGRCFFPINYIQEGKLCWQTSNASCMLLDLIIKLHTEILCYFTHFLQKATVNSIITGRLIVIQDLKLKILDMWPFIVVRFNPRRGHIRHNFYCLRCPKSHILTFSLESKLCDKKVPKLALWQVKYDKKNQTR